LGLVTGNDDFLKEKAKLLIARERELLAMKRKHKRMVLWMALAQHLPELVDPKMDIAEVCRRVADRAATVVDLHTVVFFSIEGSELRRVAGTGVVRAKQVELEPAVSALLADQRSGLCLETHEDSRQALAAAVGLCRFLWHRISPSAGSDLLLVAGFDRDRARYYAAFDEDDLAHFASNAHQLGLLLRNSLLVRELEADKQSLQQFNVDLERRVEERTRELASANEELQQVVETLRLRDQRLREDVEEARRFQRMVLADVPQSPAVDFAALFQPLERVGGDVYDVCEIRPGVYRIFLADATGHGVQAAMRTILIKTEYDRLKAAHVRPHRLLQDLNRRLVALFPDGELMCTACCVDVVVHDHGAQAVYANAGNTPIVHWTAGEMRPIYGDTPFLGVDGSVWPEPIDLTLNPGDVLLVASDALCEQQNGHGASFEGAMGGAILARRGPASEFLDRLVRAFDAFRGAEPLADDLTLVVASVPVAGAPAQP
jgi:serine phosphatase RsbU (regulator of sigma subunit)